MCSSKGVIFLYVPDRYTIGLRVRCYTYLALLGYINDHGGLISLYFLALCCGTELMGTGLMRMYVFDNLFLLVDVYMDVMLVAGVIKAVDLI